MRLWPRFMLLILAAAGFLAVREYLLLSAEPQRLTDLAIHQVQSDDHAAQALRVADGSKNWLLSGWAPLLWIVAIAVCLFGCDLPRLVKRNRQR